MEGFLYILSKYEIEISSINAKNQIDNLKEVTHTFNISQNNQALYIYYTNQYKDYPYKYKNRFNFCPIGEFTIDKYDLMDRLINFSHQKKRDLISKLNGSFLISLADINENIVDIFTHVARIENAYIHESTECIVVGSDPLIVSAFSNKSYTPIFDSSNFISFFEMGHFADDLSPFENVICLPANTHVKIVNGEVKYIPIDNTFDDIMTLEANDYLNSKISETFLDAMNILPKNEVIKLGLTGGKDSRILLSSLVQKNMDIQTHTNGFEDHPDVVIAKEIANYYDIPHTVNAPQLEKEQKMEIDLYNRLVETMKSTSGQIYAYENIGKLGNFKNHTIISGVGGEIIRGGYNVNNLNSKNGEKLLKNKFSKYTDFYLNSSGKFIDHIDQLIDSEDNYLKVFLKHYILYRMGRWSGDSRMAKNYSSHSYMPFLDNQLVKLAMKIKPHTLMSGKLHFELLKHLDINLTEFRFERNRYPFEKSGPTSTEDFKSWFARRPLYSTSEVGKYNWRVLANGQDEIINAFKEILLSDRNHIIYDVISYDKVESLLYSDLDEKYNVLLWSLASMLTYVNFINNKEPVLDKPIELNLPRDEVDEVSDTRKLINLTETFNNPTNSVSIIPNKKNGFSISVNNNKWNPYIKTFKGGFQQVPLEEDNYIKNAKTLRVNVTFSKIKDKIKLYIILYSELERVRTIAVPYSIYEENLLIFDEEINLEGDYHYFRIAAKLPGVDLKKKYYLHYSFAEIKY